MTGSARWEILEKIGAYAAVELSTEEARETKRFILEEPKAWRLANSYIRLLALLGAIGEESLRQKRSQTTPSSGQRVADGEWRAAPTRRNEGGQLEPYRET